MAADETIGVKFHIDISNLKSGLTQAKRLTNAATAEFKAAVAGVEDWEKNTEGLSAKIKELNKNIEVQEEVVRASKEAYEKAKSELGEMNAHTLTLEKSMHKSIETLQKSKTELDKYSKALEDIKNGNKTLEQSLDELNNEIKLSNSEFDKAVAGIEDWDSTTDGLNKKLKNLNEVLSSQEKIVGLLQVEYEKVSQETGETSEHTTKLKTALNKAQAEVSKTKTEIDKYGTELKDVESGTKRTQEATANLNDGFTTAKAVIADLVANAVRKLAEGLKDVTMAAFEAGMTFESAFAGVKKTVDATEEQYKALEKEMISLSKVMPTTADEIANVGEVAGQLGIAYDDILGFSKVMIDLGNSTNLSSTQAAESLAKFANITNMSAKDYDRLGATIVELGNNFATTESDIVEMATRLAATGELTGLTQSQILSLATAMSSVGIEAEAGGSAMSKLLKNLQLAVELGGQDLKDFAKVAGMSVQDFKKAFEKDATKALSAFIGGLNDTERNGKSAIAILDDMGLTEVRLSNTILSLANASEVMNKSVELGSKAWEENTALVIEADKRYATTESQMKMMQNSMKAMGIAAYQKFQKPLANAFSKVTKVFDNLTKSISSGKLSKSVDKITEAFADFLEVAIEFAAEWITKIINGIAKLIDNWDTLKPIIVGVTTAWLAFNVAQKASLALFGQSGIIATVSALYTALKGVLTGATTAQKGLNTAMKANLFGIVAAAVIGLVAVVKTLVEKETELQKQIKEEAKAYEETTNKINESIEARKMLTDAQNESIKSGLAEAENSKILIAELQKITDENGKVKEGYEARASYILNELNKAYETEYSIIDGAITKNGEEVKSIQEVINTMDTLIKKKQAKIILDANEDTYADAIKNQAQYYYELEEAESNASRAQETYNKALEEYRTATSKLNKEYDNSKWYTAGSREAYKSYQALQEAEKNLQTVQQTVGESEKLVNETAESISNYQYLSTLYAQGTTESINEMLSTVGTSYEKNGEMVKKNLGEQLGYLIYYRDQAKQTYEDDSKNQTETAKQTNKALLDNYNQRIIDYLNQLKSITSLTEQNSPEVVEAWRLMAQNSSTEFYAYMKTLPIDMQIILSNMVNGIDTMSPEVQTALTTLATNSELSFEQVISQLPPAMQEELKNVIAKMNENDPILQAIAANMGINVANELDQSPTAIQSAEEMIEKYGNPFETDTTPQTNAEKLALETIGKLGQMTGAETAGKNVLDGFNSGLNNSKKRNNILGAANNLANAVLKKLNSAFDINSPSKETQKQAEYLIEGWVVGFKKYASKVLGAAGGLAGNITEELSLSDGLAQLKSNVSNSIASSNNSYSGNVGKGIGQAQGKTQVINFNQVNNSPKALSRREVYRQTKNAVSVLKGV